LASIDAVLAEKMEIVIPNYPVRISAGRERTGYRGYARARTHAKRLEVKWKMETKAKSIEQAKSQPRRIRVAYLAFRRCQRALLLNLA